MRPVLDGDFAVTCDTCGAQIMWEGKGKKAVQVCDCERAVTFVSPGRKKCSAKNAKAKGDGGERELVKAAEGWGWQAYRTAGSGAHGTRNNESAFATDVRLKLGDLVITAECKRHASVAGVKTLNKLRAGSDVLWLREDQQEAFVFMPASVWALAMSRAAEGSK
jgi:hypothetical protein